MPRLATKGAPRILTADLFRDTLTAFAASSKQGPIPPGTGLVVNRFSLAQALRQIQKGCRDDVVAEANEDRPFLRALEAPDAP